MLSPNQIRQAEFGLQFRGYDRNQVDELLEAAAVALESTRNDAMTIERRFRAAAARVQELTAARTADESRDDASGAVEQDRQAEQDRQTELMTLTAQIEQLERRRAELDEQITERAAKLRADQDRLRGVADSLRTLADQRFELDESLDAEQDLQQAPGLPESATPELPEVPPDGPPSDAAQTAAVQTTAADTEAATQATPDPEATGSPPSGPRRADEAGPNPR